MTDLTTARDARPNGDAGSTSAPLTLSRLRSSVLLKVVVALAVALVFSSLVTSVVAARLTGSLLETRARQLARGQVTIVEEAYAERERTLIFNLRNLAQIFNARGMFDPGQRAELIAELGRASGNLDLDLLRVLEDRDGQFTTIGGIGDDVANPEPLRRALGQGSSSGLFLARSGTFVQVTMVPTLIGDRYLVLLGGYSFSDRFAYRLRSQIGNVDDVLLVASGRVVGSTLTDPPLRPPPADASVLPTSPVAIRFQDADRLVVYAPVRAGGYPVEGGIGLLVTSSVAPLDRALARTRWVTTLLLTLVTIAVAWLLFRYVIRPLGRLAHTASRIADGELDARFEVSTRDEVGVLAAGLERMRLELRTKLDLIAQQASQLRHSSQRIMTAEDNERHRLARDLHDGVQQQLVVLRMQVAIAEEDAREVSPTTVEQFERIGLDLDATIEQLREVTQNLYPSILVDRGLTPAVRSRLGQLPVSARLTCSPDPLPRVAPEVETAAYFLLSEAITNALKHAGAAQITISLSLAESALTVEVRDDGRGFVVDGTDRHGGLLHMDDRVRSFGGDLQIDSAPGAGTLVRAELPLPPPVDTVAAGPAPVTSAAST